MDTRFYIAFTPSCNKDSMAAQILQECVSKGEAEAKLTDWIRLPLKNYRFKECEACVKRRTLLKEAEEKDGSDFDDDEGEHADLFEPIMHERNSTCVNNIRCDDFGDESSVELFSFPGMKREDYDNLGIEINCVKCVRPCLFWIIEHQPETNARKIILKKLRDTVL